MFRLLFEILSMADWVSPAIETGKDFNHWLSDNTPTEEISVDKFSLTDEKRRLEQEGYAIVSTASSPFHREAIITVVKNNNEPRSRQ